MTELQEKTITFRKRRRLGCILMFLWLPFLVLLCNISYVIYHSHINFPDYIFPIILLIFSIITIKINNKVVKSQCPNCGELYFNKGIISIVFTRKCQHCGFHLNYKFSKEEDLN